MTPIFKKNAMGTPMPFYTLTRKGFTDWLANLGQNAIVGRRGVSCNCPIATYLFASGDRSAVVTSSHRICYGRRVALPKWAKSFVYLVDNSKTTPDDYEVKAREALTIMRTILRWI